MKPLTFVFTSAPHFTARGREGIDAVLATSALCDGIQVIFVNQGVAHLLNGQDTTGIGTKNYAPMLKLFELYDIDEVYACRQSLDDMGLSSAELCIEVKLREPGEITGMLRNSHKVIQF
ncbi:sulfurtransferase complex subunit TusC [Vibrio salinus]|uniref:sulfurtransferase complex subunit TusC n=1 Tax=Vibrio salinus TaxID=2899784 RepID=UPI001E50B036|nr:sulfurtransferase complex subunit TusC [Vibrio salinus]MCE0493478.1 sulfurtransferase complex subunit TusC [Vibrio salinus]